MNRPEKASVLTIIKQIDCLERDFKYKITIKKDETPRLKWEDAVPKIYEFPYLVEYKKIPVERLFMVATEQVVSFSTSSLRKTYLSMDLAIACVN